MAEKEAQLIADQDEVLKYPLPFYVVRANRQKLWWKEQAMAVQKPEQSRRNHLKRTG